MKKIWFFVLLIASQMFGQEKELEAAIAGKLDFAADAYAGFDGFGFHYFISNNVLTKTDGRISLEFSKNALGRLTRVDIENPLLIVLFYENFNAAVLLDNQLNEVRQIDFSGLEVNIVAHAVGMASQNRLWVYDGLSQRLGLFDYLNNSWNPISSPLQQSFNSYQTDLNNFQWIDLKQDWYASDIFGKIQTLGKAPESDRIRFVSGTAFFYTKDNKLYFRDLKNNLFYSVPGNANLPKNFYYKDQILAIFTGSGITNYKINLP